MEEIYYDDFVNLIKEHRITDGNNCPGEYVIRAFMEDHLQYMRMGISDLYEINVVVAVESELGQNKGYLIDNWTVREVVDKISEHISKAHFCNGNESFFVQVRDNYFEIVIEPIVD